MSGRRTPNSVAPLPAKGSSATARTSERPLGRPVNVDGEDTRRHVLATSRECFATYGYAATTNRIIAERAGYTTAAVYHHFGRKSDLMLAVYEATEMENFAMMCAALKGKTTFVDKVEAVLEATNASLTSDRTQANFMFVARQEAKRHEELSAISHDRVFAELFEELVAEAVDAGEIAAADSKAVRGVLMVLVGGLANLGTDVGPAARLHAVKGCRKLLEGSLINPSQRTPPN